MNTPSALLLLAILVSCAMSPAKAAVILAGNPNDGTGTLTITDDITLEVIQSSTDVRAIIFDDWASTVDTTRSGAGFTAGFVEYTINSGPTQSTAGASLTDNAVTSFGPDITPGDGYILWSALSVNAGEFFTLKAGSWTLGNTDGFNLSPVGTFTGDVFLIDNGGNRLTGITTVPEPSLATLLVFPSLVLLKRRRRA